MPEYPMSLEASLSLGLLVEGVTLGVTQDTVWICLGDCNLIVFKIARSVVTSSHEVMLDFVAKYEQGLSSCSALALCLNIICTCKRVLLQCIQKAGCPSRLAVTLDATSFCVIASLAS